MVQPSYMVKTISNESCGAYVAKPDVDLGNATMVTAVIQGDGFANVTISNGQVDGVDISTIPRHLKASYAEQEEAVSTWTTIAFSGSQVLYKVIWAAELGLFVGVSSFSHILTSPDSITWTNHNAPTPGIRGVCWSPELKLLVAVSTNAQEFTPVLTSTDGYTWVQSTDTAGAGLGFQSVAWSPKLRLFAAFDTPTGGVVSSNGYNWTKIQQQGPADFGLTRDLIWCDELGLFVGVGAAYDDTTGVVDSIGGSITSTNGYMWKHNAGPPGMWFGLAYSPELGILVAVDNGPTHNVMTSVDGKRWVVRPAPDSSWRSVSWSPQLGVFVAIANGGTYRTMWSRDGINWIPNTVTAADEPYMTTLDWSPELGRFAQLGPANVALISALVVPRSKSTLLVSPAHASFDSYGNLTMTTRIDAPDAAFQTVAIDNANITHLTTATANISTLVGQVGIGTIAPSAGNALHVVGNIFASGNVSAPTFAGNVTATALSTTTMAASGNVTCGNASATGSVTAASFVGNVNATTLSTTTLTATGNITTSGNVSATGNITASLFAGNVIANTIIASSNVTTVTIAAAPGSTTTASYNFTNSAGTGMYSPLASTLGFVTTGEERVRITSEGFVGFNTTAPTEQLHVVGNVLVTGSLMTDTGNVSVAGSVTVPGGTAAFPTYSFSDTNAGTFSPDSNTFAVSTGSIERVRIDSNGFMGLGTVAPETTLHVAGPSTFQSIHEVTTALTGATGVLDHNWNLGSIFYHTSIADNFTVNVQNLPSLDGRTTTLTLVLVQGVTARMATSVQISGVAHAILWEAGFVPTGTSSKWNIVTFSFVRIAGAWTVFGQSVVFG